MRNILNIIIGLGLIVTTNCLASEFDDSITIASLNPKSQAKVGKSTSIIDSTILEDYHIYKLVDCFHNVPGVYTKSINGLDTIRIRGARSIDTVLLYNGIPLRDPSDPQGSTNPLIGSILIPPTDRVETVCGASSTLWGSEAIGGVVNVVPKVEKSNILIEYGADTYRERIGIGRESWYVEANSVESPDRSLSNLNAIGNVHLGDSINSQATLILTQDNARLLNAPVIREWSLINATDDLNDRRQCWLFHSGYNTKVNLGDRLTLTNKTGVTSSSRRYVFNPDSIGDYWGDETYEGVDFTEINFLSYEFDHTILSLGHQYNHQWYELSGLNQSDQSDVFSNDYFIEVDSSIYETNLTIAGRINTDESAKSRTTFDISASRILEGIDTSIRSHYGTSYRQPSLYERHGAYLTDYGRFEIGNAGLSPERGESFDVGVSKDIWKMGSVSCSVFRNTLTNSIEWRGSTYNNTSDIRTTQGVEVTYEHYILDCLSIRSSYTHTVGDDLVDVPKNLWDLSARYKKDKVSASVRGRFVGCHQIRVFDEQSFTVRNVEEHSYCSISASVEYQWRPNISLFARGDNLGGEYVVGGYQEETKVYGGIRCTL